MPSLSQILTFSHLLGLALGPGCAAAKLTLLLKARHDVAFVPGYLLASKAITPWIIAGQVLLTVSGIVWIVQGFPLVTTLIVKIALVGALWLLGPLINNVFEPRFRKLSPGPGESASEGFVRAQKAYVIAEVIATGLFYAVIVIWILF